MLFDKFKKKNQKSNTTPEPHIISITCPNCGKKHQVTYVKITAYYLDGTPQDIEGALSQIVLCDCGCVCKEGMYHWEALSNIINSVEYQDILNSNYDMVEKKLRLMAFFPVVYGCTEIWLTHIISPTNLSQELHNAISKLQNIPKQFAPLDFGPVIPGRYLPLFNWRAPFNITINLQCADLYRRAGCFSQALDILNQEATESAQNTCLQNYIELQRKLIADENTHSL